MLDSELNYLYEMEADLKTYFFILSENLAI